MKPSKNLSEAINRLMNVVSYLLIVVFQALAQIWGCTFIETSAKSRMNVNEVFAEIAREMNQKSYSKDREIVCTCCVIS